MSARQNSFGSPEVSALYVRGTVKPVEEEFAIIFSGRGPVYGESFRHLQLAIKLTGKKFGATKHKANSSLLWASLNHRFLLEAWKRD